MNALLQFGERHPAFSGIVGTAAGMGAKVAAELHLVASVAGDIGMIAGAATAIMTCVIATRQLRKQAREEAAMKAFLERNKGREDE